MEKSSIPIKTLVDQYLSECHSAGMSPKTIRSYDEKLNRYVRMVGGTLNDFNLNTVRQHLTRLQSCKKRQDHPSTPTKDQYLSPTTIRNHARVLTSFARWLFDEEYTDEHLLTRLKISKANEIRMEPLSDDEITHLIATFNLKSEIGCRNAAIIWLFLDTGLRLAELVNLEMGNVFLETRRLKILGKGRKERIIPFGHQVKRLLDRYIRHLRPGPILQDR